MKCELAQTGACPDTVRLDNGRLDISFHRTIRVPETNKSFDLPPDLGRFPLYSVRQFEKCLPTSISTKGGLFFPIHEREAMWICFKTKKRFVVKIYVGGVNAVSGEPAVETMATKLRRQKLQAEGGSIQDYIVTPDQLWIDGIATAEGTVRQFVAVASGQGYTVEAQVTGEEVVDGLQFEVTKSGVPISVTCLGATKEMIIDTKDSVVEFLDLVAKTFALPADRRYIVKEVPSTVSSLSDFGVCSGDKLTVELAPTTKRVPKIITIHTKTLTGKTITTDMEDTAKTDDLKSTIYKMEGILPEHQRIIYEGKQLEEKGRYLAAYGIKHESCLHLIFRLRGGGTAPPPPTYKADMGIAAGGKIKQSISYDYYHPSIWDRSSTTTFNVQMLNTAAFETSTGLLAPECPIDATTYLAQGLPFYQLEEKKSPVKGKFDGIKSLAQMLKKDKKDEGKGKGKRPVAADPKCWTEYSVIKLNPDGTRREFRTRADLEEEVKGANGVTF
ncbi:hypothetical protein FQN50_007496 [Emmonsiellopsis sp. PD_5]|nr:hypothetical protein FQN50_007496 [Emmonsiellopsis sp. PD_5]